MSEKINQGLSSLDNKIKNFVSISGRLSKKDYLVNIIIVLLITFLLILIFTFLQEAVMNEVDSSALLTIMIIFMLALLFIQMIKRLHDMNKSGLLCLISVVPLLFILLLIYTIFWPGTIGTNKYGKDTVQDVWQEIQPKD